MKKNEWFLVTVPLAVVWILDQITKRWASKLDQVYNYDFFSLAIHHNHGAMLGLFSDLPPLLRIVSLSTGGAFLVVTYAIIQFILPIKSLKLRAGMSILLGGILGNVWDRITLGYIIDFMIIHVGPVSTGVFNVADLVQWIGYGMIATAIIRDSELLWPEIELRKNIWINPKFQIRYSILYIAAGLSLTLIGAVFSYTYLRVTIFELIGSNINLANRFLGPFVVTYIILGVAFSVILFAFGRYISHKSAGPIYALDRYVDGLINKESREFKLRQSDDFKEELESLAKKLEQLSNTASKESPPPQ